MDGNKETFFTKVKTYMTNSPLKELFLDKKFFNYTWIGVFVSVLNIALLWLFIDILGISTIVSSTIIIGGTFLLRYILLIFFKVL